MMNVVRVGLLALALVLVGGGSAFAQGGPYGNPYESQGGEPYRGGGNYYDQGGYSPVVGNVSIFLGAKTLDDYWSSAGVQDHGELSILFDINPGYWPVAFAADYRISVSDTVAGGVYLATIERNLGVRHYMQQSGGTVRPYVGGGISMATVELVDDLTGNTIAKNDGTGLWVGGGVFLDLSSAFHVGLDFALSSVDAAGEPIGGLHVGVTTGLHW